MMPSGLIKETDYCEMTSDLDGKLLRNMWSAVCRGDRHDTSRSGPLEMSQIRSISYDTTAAGRRIITFPSDLPFDHFLDQLVKYVPQAGRRDTLVKIASIRNILERSTALADLLASSREPHIEILSLAALAISADISGLKLMYGTLLAVPPIDVLVDDLAGFRNVTRVMERITRREQSGCEMRESEVWFKKKVVLLSMSHPLPNASATPSDRPWLGWNEGVRMAVDDPDARWEKAVFERLKVELEARDHRLKRIVTQLDPEIHEFSVMALFNMHEEINWQRQIVEEAERDREGSSLVLLRRLGERWNDIAASLRETEVGTRIVELIESQGKKNHSFPHLKTGTAVVRSLITHPVLRLSTKKPDILSCITLFVESAGDGILEFMIPTGKKLGDLLELPGFDQREKILRVEISRVPAAQFVDIDEVPVDIDWTDIRKSGKLGFRSLVLSYIDNDNFLMELLNNPKATGKQGVIALIALRCRSSRVLSVIANRRDLYTGFANKEVPINLLKNPAKVSLTSLRKFIHVRYVDKMSLQQLAGRGSQIKEEVRREIMHYLSSMR